MILSNFDFLSPEITLFYKGNERHSSIFSGITTILLFLFVIFLIIFLSIDFIFKKNPTSFFYNKFIENLEPTNLNSKGIFHFIFFALFSDYVYIDPKAISIIGLDRPFNDYYSDNNISKYSHYIYEVCDEDDAGELIKNFNEDNDILFKYGYCIKKYYNHLTKTVYVKNDPNFVYPHLEFGASNRKNINYGIYIQKCQNNTIINNNYCYDDETIEKFFNKNITSYNIMFIDASIDVSNYKHPIEFNYHRISNSFNAVSFTANHLNFHKAKLRTNAGTFLDEISEKTTFKFDNNEKLVRTDNFNILGTFHFWIQNEMDIYERLYKKVQDIAGGVDGIIQIIMVFIKILNLLIFNNFQVIYDFNNEIEKYINKYKKNHSLIINLSKKNSPKNLPKNKVIISMVNINKKRTFDSKLQNTVQKKSSKYFDTNPNSKNKFLYNNFMNLNLEKNNTDNIIAHSLTKIEKSFRKIKRIELICDFRLKFKKNTYLSYLIETRQKIISEENLINHHLYLKKIRTIISDLMDRNNNKKINNKENSIEFGSYHKLISNIY